MKSIKHSSFSGLVRYMTNEQNKQERVGEIRISNCQSIDANWAAIEVEATQSQNKRATGDRTYHLLISFPAGENPTKEVLKDIEDRVCASLGYASHQRISVVHYDTDNFHIHIAINKINPTRFTMHDPYLAYKTLGDIATTLELEHGLQLVNHTPRKVGSENRAEDMEHHAGVESLLGWVKRNCMEPIGSAQSWHELHQVMKEHGLELLERGNGLIIIDRAGLAIKASSVSRDYSKVKLEKRLGVFERAPPESTFSPKTKPYKTGVSPIGKRPPPHRRSKLHQLGQLKSLHMDNGIRYTQQPIYMRHNTVELYARYQSEHIQFKSIRANEMASLRMQKDRRIERAKRTGRLKRAAIKLMAGTVNKRVLYALTSKTLHDEIEKIRQQYLKDRQAIDLKYQRCAWADWLKRNATQGDKESLAALRSRESRQNLKGNTFTGELTQNTNPFQGMPGVSPDNITKTGTIIYRASSGAIRDDGEFLKISRGSTHEVRAAALRMAIKRFGHRLCINGSDEFKEWIVRTAVVLKLNVTFDEAGLERHRQDLTHILINKEHNHEHTRRADIEPRRTNRSRNEGFGSAGVDSPNGTTRQPRNGELVSINHKPHIGRIGKQPPPQSKNHLRELSQLGVVQLAGRGEVLLPSDVSRHLEHEGTQSAHQLRRSVFGSGVTPLAMTAADKYIAERELKRQTMADIPLHRRYQQQDEGLVQFAGVRHVDGEKLVLLKKEEQVIVLAVDEATVGRMKHLSVGDSVRLTANGIVVTRGRGR